MYLRQIEKLQARKSLQLCDVASYPHLKSRDRKRLIRQYKEILQIEHKEPASENVDLSWSTLRKIGKKKKK